MSIIPGNTNEWMTVRNISILDIRDYTKWEKRLLPRWAYQYICWSHCVVRTEYLSEKKMIYHQQGPPRNWSKDKGINMGKEGSQSQCAAHHGCSACVFHGNKWCRLRIYIRVGGQPSNQMLYTHPIHELLCCIYKEKGMIGIYWELILSLQEFPKVKKRKNSTS